MDWYEKPPLEQLIHDGVGHLDGGHSGRYPWGSGDHPYQHSADFLGRIKELKDAGFSQVEIAKALGLKNTNELRVQMSLARSDSRAAEVAKVKELYNDGYSPTEIARTLGYKNESSVRNLLNPEREKKPLESQVTADFLREQVEQKGMIDVGKGVERFLGISRNRLDQALYILEREGYPVYGGGVQQVTNKGKQTNFKVLCPKGTEHKDIYDVSKINSVVEYTSKNDGMSFETFRYPKSMDSSRLAIRYAEDGGKEKDGVIELKRGVDDLSLGESHYAQVRILVDDKKYLKGMAVYSDPEEFPPGVDVIFNTNKTKDVPKLDVLKDIKNDPDNPFGSLIKVNGQSTYIDKDGNEQLSLINKRADESDWSDWSNAVPAQFLSKQSKQLIEKQLTLSIADKKEEYEEICALTNPTVKKMRLQKFSEDCDSSAVQLKAAALPSQHYHVILPLIDIPENEVYAPNYKNGTKLALIRYPHGGTFEIPIVTVNNKNEKAMKLIGNTGSDAICINSKVAERLSGADFDGDTVMAIPTGNGVNITTQPQLKGLKEYKYPDGHIDIFDPKEAYPPVTKKVGDEIKIVSKVMSKAATQQQMGIISNLITDMTLKGANSEELAAAVRHSMVVIDANKHKLDYKQSEKDNHIDILKKRYQLHYDENGRPRYGASTLISAAKSKEIVLKRKGAPRINPDTGELEYKEVYEEYQVPKKTKANKAIQERIDILKKEISNETDETKKQKAVEEIKLLRSKMDYDTKVRTQDSTKMAETKDARTLSTGTIPEELYANYANSLKAMANTARKEILATEKLHYSKSARITYQNEVNSLNAKLNKALMNAPKERKAQLLANSEIKAKKEANPDLKNNKAELKKLEQMALTRARAVVGAKREPIDISDREWEAIQAGAISENNLLKILTYAKMEDVIERSTPRQRKELSPSRIAKIEAMKASGFTTEQIAEAVGVSPTTVIKVLRGQTK